MENSKFFWIFLVFLRFSFYLRSKKLRINLPRDGSCEKRNLNYHSADFSKINLKINLRWDVLDGILRLRLVIVRVQRLRDVQKVQRYIIEYTLAAEIEIHKICKIVVRLNWIHRCWLDNCTSLSCQQVQRFFHLMTKRCHRSLLTDFNVFMARKSYYFLIVWFFFCFKTNRAHKLSYQNQSLRSHLCVKRIFEFVWFQPSGLSQISISHFHVEQSNFLCCNRQFKSRLKPCAKA